jgi:hypothetical protein
MGFIELLEKLSRPFYSSKEASLDSSKGTTQLSTPEYQENPYITYDPFSLYTNNLMEQVSSAKTVNEFIKRWRQAAMLPEVDDALQEITSEAVTFDEKEKVVSLDLEALELPEAIKKKMEESFDRVLFLLDFNSRGDEIFKQWYVDGIISFEVVYREKELKEGIQKLILLSPFNFFKIKDEKTGMMKYFFHKKPSYDIVKDLGNADKTYFDEQISQINSGIWDTDKKFTLSFLQKALKVINQLSLIEDSLVIFRITRSPERRVFYIDTGNLPKTKAEEYVKSLISKYRQKRIYNTDSGTVENKSRQISILEDFWFPVSQTASGQRGTRVETLQGQNPGFNTFEDINYFVKKVYKALNVPPNRTNNDDRLQISSGVDIERDELKFFKYILKLRRKFNNLFVDLLKKDLISKEVFSIEDWNTVQEKIGFKYANSNEFSEIKKLQLLDLKTNAANGALPLMEAGLIDEFYVQREYLMLSEDEIKEIGTRLEEKAIQQAKADKEAQAAQFKAMKAAGINPGMPGQPGQPGQPPIQMPAGPGGKQESVLPKGGLPDHILNMLREGDIITNGENQLLYEDGKFRAIK